MLREMRRVLKPEGRLLIVEWERPSRGPGRAMFGLFPAAVEPRGFRDFLELDWKAYLADFGFRLESKEGFRFTTLIRAQLIRD
jgi:ubiquinone/menaquinone biosynthesis C-methylase UbiE